VDSIRLFDPETQLSERKLLQVNIIPNVTTQFEDTIKIPFMEFVPERTVVWLKDWSLIQQRGNDQLEALEAFLLHAPILKITDDADAHKKNTDKDDIVSVEKVIEQVFNKPIIELGVSGKFNQAKTSF